MLTIEFYLLSKPVTPVFKKRSSALKNGMIQLLWANSLLVASVAIQMRCKNSENFANTKTFFTFA